jgi:uncharacterized protein YgbK (DUF1537 family)
MRPFLVNFLLCFTMSNSSAWHDSGSYKNMEDRRTILVADDLTGANDTAIQFVKQGFSALVSTQAHFSDPADYADFDIISINSDSRGMSSADAYRTLRDLLVRLKQAKLGERYYKKVDSVLRGNPGAELAAVMDELDIALAIAAPSFPANRSIVEQGMLKSGRSLPLSVIDAVSRFAGSMDKKVGTIPLEIIRQGHLQGAEYVLSHHAQGVQVFVADAVSDEDLALVYRISTILEKTEKSLILAGSAGLANQIALHQGQGNREGVEQACFGVSGPALVIAGTRQGETAAQISALSAALSAPIIRFKVDLVGQGKSEEAIERAYREAAEHMGNNPVLCMVAVDSMFKSKIPEGNVAWNKADSDAESDAISSALGIVAGKLMNAFPFSVLISTGGDTSLEVCNRLGALGIQPLVEIGPGIPMGKIIGGPCGDRFIITKSGRFGKADALVEIMTYLGNCQLDENGKDR